MNYDQLATEAVRRVPTYQLEEELAALCGLLPVPMRNVLEIGAHHNGTAWLWDQLAERVIGIDTTPQRYEEFPGHLLVGSSHDPAILAQVRSLLDAEALDLLFIDGDHTYQGVTQDYEMYGPLVREGGIIAFHDINEYEVNGPDPSGGCGLHWQRLKETVGGISLSATRPGRRNPLGIGVVKVGGWSEWPL